MNIFISFSGSAREEFAIKFMNFFNKYGLHCWYDQHELFLGDMLKETIIRDGIETVDYCVLIINKNYLNRNWPCQEAIRLYEKLEIKKDAVIFPILLDISKQEVKNSQLNFILSIKYQFLHTGEEITTVAFQILNRIFHDIAKQYKFHNTSEATNYFKRLTRTESIDIYNALTMLDKFECTDYKARSIFLICLLRLFNNNPYEETIREISYLIYNNDNITFDIYKITESIFLICASLFTD